MVFFYVLLPFLNVILLINFRAAYVSVPCHILHFPDVLNFQPVGDNRCSDLIQVFYFRIDFWGIKKSPILRGFLFFLLLSSLLCQVCFAYARTQDPAAPKGIVSRFSSFQTINVQVLWRWLIS